MTAVLSYNTALTAITQGCGSFRLEMSHYHCVPAPLAAKILATAKQPAHDETEEGLHAIKPHRLH